MKIEIALDFIFYSVSTAAEAKRGRAAAAEVPEPAMKSSASRAGAVGLEAEALANEKLIGAGRMATLGMAGMVGMGSTIQRKDATETAEDPGFFEKYVVPIHDQWLKAQKWWAGASEEDKAKISKDVLEKTKDELEANPAYKVLKQHPKGKEFGEFVVEALEASADVARYGEAETWTERGKIALRTEVKWLKKYIDENYPDVGKKIDTVITAVNFTDNMIALIRKLNEIETVRRLDDPDKKTELLEGIFGDLAELTESIPEGAPGVKEFKKVWKEAFLTMKKNARVVVAAYYRSINYLEREHVYREGEGYVTPDAKEPPTVATQPQVERILSPEAAARQAAQRKILNRFWTHRERLRWEICIKKGYNVVDKEYPELTKFDQETRRLNGELLDQFEIAWKAQRRLVDLGEMDAEGWAKYRNLIEPQWEEEQAKYWNAVEALARLTGDVPPTKAKSKPAPIKPARKSASSGLATTGLEAEALANELAVARLASAIVTRHASVPMLLMRPDGEPTTVDDRIKAFLSSQSKGPLALRIPLMSTRELAALVRGSTVPGVDLLRDEAVARIIDEWMAERRTATESPSSGMGGLGAPPVGPAPPSPLGSRLTDLGRFLGRIPTSLSLGDPRQLQFTAAPGGLTLAHETPGLKLSAGMDWGRVFNAEAAYRDLRFSASADVLGSERQSLSFGLQYGPDAPDVSGMGKTFQGAGQAAGHALVNVPRFVSYLREGGAEELRGIPDAVEQARRIAGERERRIPVSFGLTATVNREGNGPPGVAVTGNLTLAWDVLKKAKAGASPQQRQKDIAAAIPRDGGQTLSADVAERLEGFFGRRLPGVRIHTGPAAGAAATQMGAEAFTVGRDVYFGAGKYDPSSRQGLGLLAHEVTHVLQQDRQPSAKIRRAGGGDTGALEREAESVAEAIVTASGAVDSGELVIADYRRTYRPGNQPLTKEERARLEEISARGRNVCERILSAEHPSLLTGNLGLSRLRMSLDIDLDGTTPDVAAQAWGRRMAETIVQAAAASRPLAAVPAATRPLRRGAKRKSGRQSVTVQVKWSQDWVEFYHRLVGAVASALAIPEAPLWAPIHAPGFRFHVDHPDYSTLKEGQSIPVRVHVTLNFDDDGEPSVSDAAVEPASGAKTAAQTAPPPVKEPEPPKPGETREDRLRRQATNLVDTISKLVVDTDTQGYAGVSVAITHSGDELSPAFELRGTKTGRPSGTIPVLDRTVRESLEGPLKLALNADMPGRLQLEFARDDRGVMRLASSTFERAKPSEPDVFAKFLADVVLQLSPEPVVLRPKGQGPQTLRITPRSSVPSPRDFAITEHWTLKQESLVTWSLLAEGSLAWPPGTTDGAPFEQGISEPGTYAVTLELIGLDKQSHKTLTKTFKAEEPRQLSTSTERRKSILEGAPGAIKVTSGSASKGGDEPLYEWQIKGRLPVLQNDETIEAMAKKYGVDADLVRAIMFMESSHGYYDVVNPKEKSIRPMNVHAEFWKDLGYSREQLKDPAKNIEAGVKIIRGIQDRVEDPSIEKIATLYNNLSADEVNEYGRRVKRIYDERLWMGAGATPRAEEPKRRAVSRMDADRGAAEAEASAVEAAMVAGIDGSNAFTAIPPGQIQRAIAKREYGPEYDEYARRLQEAMQGLGTDEEAIFAVLQQARATHKGIDALKKAYESNYGVTLEAALRDEMSGSELNLALALLGDKKAEAEVKLEPRTLADDEYTKAADRLIAAMKGLGTDEEAIFATLLPFAGAFGSIRQLKEAYKTKVGGASIDALEEALRDELSESELDYALKLLHGPAAPAKGMAATILDEARREATMAPKTPCTVASIKRFMRAYLDHYYLDGRLAETERLHADPKAVEKHKVARQELRDKLKELLGPVGDHYLDGGPSADQVGAVVEKTFRDADIFGNADGKLLYKRWQITPGQIEDVGQGAPRGLHDRDVAQQVTRPVTKEDDSPVNIKPALWNEILTRGAVIQTWITVESATTFKCPKDKQFGKDNCGHSFIFVEYVYSPDESPPAKAPHQWALFGSGGTPLNTRGQVDTTRQAVTEIRNLHLVGLRIIDQKGYHIIMKNPQYNTKAIVSDAARVKWLTNSEVWYAARW